MSHFKDYFYRALGRLFSRHPKIAIKWEVILDYHSHLFPWRNPALHPDNPWDVSWITKKGKETKGDFGKYLRKMVDDLLIHQTHKGVSLVIPNERDYKEMIEELNRLAAEILPPTFDVVSGEDIVTQYATDRWSCMSGPEKSHRIRFYAVNSVGLVLAKNPKTKGVMARSLLWREILINDVTPAQFLDLSYPRYFSGGLFRGWARRNGVLFHQDVNDQFTVRNLTPVPVLPFFDSFKYGYLNPAEKILHLSSAESLSLPQEYIELDFENPGDFDITKHLN